MEKVRQLIRAQRIALEARIDAWAIKLDAHIEARARKGEQSPDLPQANADFIALGARKEINDAQLKTDVAALNLILKSAGYSSPQILRLLAGLYGVTMYNTPEHIIIDGIKYSQLEIENYFFRLCSMESSACIEYRKSEMTKMFPDRGNLPAGKLN